MPTPSRLLFDHAQFSALCERFRVQSPPELRDLGTVLSAAALIRIGEVVSCGGPPAPQAVDDPASPSTAPAFRLRQWYDTGDDWAAVNDHLDFDLHGLNSMTHIDALELFFWKNRDFHGHTTPDLTSQRLPESLTALRGGIVGRGLLVDVPRITGHAIPAGYVITPDDISTTLLAQSTITRPGDILFFRFGRQQPVKSEDVIGDFHTPGLSIASADWVHTAQPCVIVTDGGLDPMPSEVAGLPTPWHLLLLTQLGIHLIDVAHLDALAATCARLNCWEFFCTIAPLDLPHASGSPVNPLAIF